MAEPQKLAGLHRSHNRLSHITLSRRPASGRAPRSSCEDTHFGWVFATRPTTPAEVGPTCANGQQASAQTCALGWPAGTGNYGIITKGDATIPDKNIYKPILVGGDFDDTHLKTQNHPGNFQEDKYQCSNPKCQNNPYCEAPPGPQECTGCVGGTSGVCKTSAGVCSELLFGACATGTTPC